MRLSRLIAVFVAVVAAAGAWLSLGREMYVVAGGPVRIVRDLESRNVEDPSVVVATLQAGDRVRVIGCRNEKDDQLYLVRTKDQIEGYVAGWPFTLEREPWSLFSRKVLC